MLELVEGPTLADRIGRGPIPLDEALAIAHKIAEALDAAHERGIVHCDLKSSNVKVTDDGTVKVLDFGPAKVFTDETPNSRLLAFTQNVTSYWCGLKWCNCLVFM